MHMSTLTQTPIQIRVPADTHSLLFKALENINGNEEVKTIWKVLNVNDIDRL
jgi:metal-dependent HD superfamily phosphatase/phosphodiesterase